MDGYCDQCKTVLEAMVCYYHFCSCQKARPSLTAQDIERGNKKRATDDMRREYIKEKDTKLKKCGSVSGGKFSKPMTRSKITSEPTFPMKDLSLPAKIKDGFLVGYV